MKLVFPISFNILFVCHLVTTVGHHTFFESMESPDWCYTDLSCNELTWKGACNSDCHQSPIDLPSDLSTVPFHREVVQNFPRSQLLFDKFYMDYRGHTIQINTAGERFQFTRELHGNHTVSYTLHGIDLHWGPNNTVGSEHTINGVAYSAEVHLVFHDQTEDTEDTNQKEEDFGYLIIGILLEAEDGSTQKQNVSKWMQPIVDKSLEIQNYNPINIRQDLDLRDLFQDFAAYRYPGSFTTPSCRPAEWWVLRTPVKIPDEHMDSLRNAYVNGVPIVGNNYRSTKSSHGGDISLIKIEYA